MGLNWIGFDALLGWVWSGWRSRVSQGGVQQSDQAWSGLVCLVVDGPCLHHRFSKLGPVTTALPYKLAEGLDMHHIKCWELSDSYSNAAVQGRTVRLVAYCNDSTPPRLNGTQGLDLR